MNAIRQSVDGDMAVCLNRIKEGSLDAFEMFYQRAAPFVTGIAYRMLGDRMEAEDICHDVLLGVVSRPDKYNPERGSVEAWLAVLTKSRCLDLLRKRGKVLLGENGFCEELAGGSAAAEALPERRVLDKLEGEALRRAIRELPREQRELVAAAYYADCSQSELARRWSVPLGTVKSRVRYGLNHLRKAMEKMGWVKEGEGDPS